MKRVLGASLLLGMLVADGHVGAQVVNAIPPEPRFSNVTRKVGLPTGERRSWGSNFVDYDGDGRVDIFDNRHMSKPALFRNRPRGFVRHAERFARTYVDRHQCAWGEADGDRRMDLACTSGARRGLGTDPNQLFLQRRNGTFVNRARMFGVKYGAGRARSVNWIDHDGDGKLDLFIGNAYRDGWPNVLFRNEGGSFTRASVGVDEHLSTSSSTWTDWNRDGAPDLLVTQSKGPLVAYENKGGTFEAVKLVGLPDEPGWKSASWGDYDGDGWPDLHLITRRRSLILRNQGGVFVPVHDLQMRPLRTSVWLDVDNDGYLDTYIVRGANRASGSRVNRPNVLLMQRNGTFERVRHRSFRGPRKGNGDAASAGDFDRDGRIDLFVSNGHSPKHWRGPAILLQNTTQGGNGAGLVLRGPPGNPAGFGSTLQVTAAALVYERYLNDGVAGLIQTEAGYQHLGLGVSGIGHVRVTWPDGRSDCTTVEARKVTRLPIGSAPC